MCRVSILVANFPSLFFLIFILDLNEHRSHTLRYVLKNKATNDVYFVIVFSALLLEEVEEQERMMGVSAETTEKVPAPAPAPVVAAATATAAGTAKQKELAFEPRDDDLD
jgi:hypothetical protein